MWDAVSTFVRDHENFVVTTHINPEGDAIGSEIAFAEFLKSIGKKATIVNSSETPANCLFLEGAGDIVVYDEDFDRRILDEADAVVIVDVNNWDHIGPFGQLLKKDSTARVCIDHHQDAAADIAEIIVTDTKAAAAALLVYDFIKFMKANITPAIADAVYTAILTDTGSFRFSNTDRRAFIAAAELCEAGVAPFGIYRKVYAKSWGASRLVGSALSTLDKNADGRIAWIYISQEMLSAAGAIYEDSDGLVEMVRSIEGVEICLIFKELPGGEIKVSLRSNGKVDAFEIARSYGGGGHRMASGMRLDGPMESAINTLVSVCEAKLP
jgi:phosphoesterase RecJ-like protein